MAKVKAYELRTKGKEELFKKLEELKQELAGLRVQKVSGTQNAKVARIGTVRKDIARVLTVITQKKREQLKAFHSKRKYQPLDLRVKKTRAIRRQLTEFELSKETEREKKKRIHFGPRKYAVKA